MAQTLSASSAKQYFSRNNLFSWTFYRRVISLRRRRWKGLMKPRIQLINVMYLEHRRRQTVKAKRKLIFLCVGHSEWDVLLYLKWGAVCRVPCLRNVHSTQRMPLTQRARPLVRSRSLVRTPKNTRMLNAKRRQILFYVSFRFDYDAQMWSRRSGCRLSAIHCWQNVIMIIPL